MPTYTWKNTKTGETVDVQRPIAEASTPPEGEGPWERVFAFGVGRVEGGGSSPARTSTRSK